jgi:hypothetical protein
LKTAERLGQMLGVSRATVEREAEFARNLDAITERVPEARKEILSGKIRLTQAQLKALAKARPKAIEGVRLPTEMDVQRAREILNELRRRRGDHRRPQDELQYIDRLLRRF